MNKNLLIVFVALLLSLLRPAAAQEGFNVLKEGKPGSTPSKVGYTITEDMPAPSHILSLTAGALYGDGFPNQNLATRTGPVPYNESNHDYETTVDFNAEGISAMGNATAFIRCQTDSGFDSLNKLNQPAPCVSGSTGVMVCTFDPKVPGSFTYVPNCNIYMYNISQDASGNYKKGGKANVRYVNGVLTTYLTFGKNPDEPPDYPYTGGLSTDTYRFIATAPGYHVYSVMGSDSNRGSDWPGTGCVIIMIADAGVDWVGQMGSSDLANLLAGQLNTQTDANGVSHNWPTALNTVYPPAPSDPGGTSTETTISTGGGSGGSTTVSDGLITPTGHIESSGITSYASGGSVIATDGRAIMDGDTSTFVATPNPSGEYVGLAFASSPITKIMIYPRAGFASRLAGGYITASANGTDWFSIATLPSSVPEGAWVTLNITDTRSVTQVRFFSVNNNYCDMAEMSVYGTPTTTTSGSGGGGVTATTTTTTTNPTVVNPVGGKQGGGWFDGFWSNFKAVMSDLFAPQQADIDALKASAAQFGTWGPFAFLSSIQQTWNSVSTYGGGIGGLPGNELSSSDAGYWVIHLDEFAYWKNLAVGLAHPQSYDPTSDPIPTPRATFMDSMTLHWIDLRPFAPVLIIARLFMLVGLWLSVLLGLRNRLTPELKA